MQPCESYISLHKPATVTTDTNTSTVVYEEMRQD